MDAPATAFELKVEIPNGDTMSHEQPDSESEHGYQRLQAPLGRPEREHRA